MTSEFGKMRYYVYILSNWNNNVLYIGITDNLVRRIYEHKNKVIDGFTSRYDIKKLVYYETTNDIVEAIKREKQLKGWTRIRKEKLIDSINPDRKDLWAEIIS